jgi:predicted MFS family arabinose efflux permease
MDPRPTLKHNRDFLKLWTAQGVSAFGSMFGALALTALLYLHATPGQMGLLAMSQGLPALLFALPAGVLVDRLPRRLLLIVADLGRFAALLTVPAAAALGALSIGQLYAVAFLADALEVAFDLAYPSYLPGLVQDDELLAANARLFGTKSVAEVGSPAAGGLIAQVAGGPVAVLVDALTFLFSGVSLSLIRRAPEASTAPVDAASFRREVAEGLRSLWRSAVLRALAASGATVAFFGGFLSALYGVYLIRTLHFSPALMGVTIGAGGLGSIGGAVLTGRLTRGLGYGRAILVARVMHDLFTFLIPLAGGPKAVAFGMIVVAQAGGDPFWTSHDIATMSLRQAIVPQHLLGRVSSGMHVLQAGMLPLGALVAGVMAETLGVRETLFVAAGGMTLGIAWLLFSPVPSLRALPAAGDQSEIERQQPQ